MTKQFLKITTIILSMTVTLFANDTDFDGVDDSRDLCPRTSFDLMVDNNGCPESKHITLLLGEELSVGKYGGTENVITDRTTAFIAYNAKDWGYAVSTSTSTTRSNSLTTSGMGDIYSTLSYHGLGSQNLLVSLQVGAKIATADIDIGTGENDYNVRASSVYITDKLSYLSSVGYTITGDTDIIYNDMLNLSFGLGKQMNKSLYLSTSVNYVSAYVEGSDNGLSAMLYGAYTLSDSWFATASYTKGLSDAVADHSISISIGSMF